MLTTGCGEALLESGTHRLSCLTHDVWDITGLVQWLRWSEAPGPSLFGRGRRHATLSCVCAGCVCVCVWCASTLLCVSLQLLYMGHAYVLVGIHVPVYFRDSLGAKAGGGGGACDSACRSVCGSGSVFSGVGWECMCMFVWMGLVHLWISLVLSFLFV